MNLVHWNHGNEIPFVTVTEFKVGYEVKVLNCRKVYLMESEAKF